ncbi:DUF5056 domain-containing protein [Bacteroides sp. 224]|uniref:DUF5056 domain-containing protein n=1 Tax=Bacteroides sp. 224 TaxID=2302936 RepID=UPI0013CFE7E8|nr:DUF5056 domain-containing protein [Bacteroides sp. 224]NDV65305.1 hypothetical protein [Bacteroides sp. 224]
MKEEDKLLKRFGTENKFTVPENYFEQLTSEVMDKLPEHESSKFEYKEPTVWERFKPWVYMAAMFIGAALIIRVASYNPNPFEQKESPVAENATEQLISDEYLDYALSQSMLDDYSLYVYLTDANAE